MKPFVIGVAGGSGSGKTTMVEKLLNRGGGDRILLLQHDAYYRDLSHLSPKERDEVNFDHPDSLETELLVEHLKRFIEGEERVAVPRYDYSQHVRFSEMQMEESKPIILVEGILVFQDYSLRQLMDLKIFVDTDSDLRFIRRMERDVVERGRTRESVVQQYLTTVKPMHDQFVEPSKRYADIIINENRANPVALNIIATQIEFLLRKSKPR